MVASAVLPAILILAPAGALAAPQAGQGDGAKPPAAVSHADPQAAEPQPDVFVPTMPNTVCPIMGKPVSEHLFVDTSYGRFYLCCKPCGAEVLVDVDLAYRTSFPIDKPAENKTCPLTGKPVPEDAPTVSIQGLSIRLSSPECVAVAREIPQVVLARLEHPEWTHVDNRTCPVSGQPAGRNTILVVKGHLVHVADLKLLEQVRAQPDAILAKAKEIAEKERVEREAKEAAAKKAAQEAAGGAGGNEAAKNR